MDDCQELLIQPGVPPNALLRVVFHDPTTDIYSWIDAVLGTWPTKIILRGRVAYVYIRYNDDDPGIHYWSQVKEGIRSPEIATDTVLVDPDSVIGWDAIEDALRTVRETLTTHESYEEIKKLVALAHVEIVSDEYVRNWAWLEDDYQYEIDWEAYAQKLLQEEEQTE